MFWIRTSEISLTVSGKIGYMQYPPCYKDMSFWISDAFTENNLCEVVRGIAGDLVEEVS